MLHRRRIGRATFQDEDRRHHGAHHQGAEAQGGHEAFFVPNQLELGIILLLQKKLFYAMYDTTKGGEDT
jgi:hypothetical protein